MKFRLILPLLAISLTLFSCDYVKKAYQETFGEQSKSRRRFILVFTYLHEIGMRKSEAAEPIIIMRQM